MMRLLPGFSEQKLLVLIRTLLIFPPGHYRHSENGVGPIDAKSSLKVTLPAIRLFTQGDDILRIIYDEGYGQKLDWRATQRLHRGELLSVPAFAEMTSERLVRAEDSMRHSSWQIPRLPMALSLGSGGLYHHGIGATEASRIFLDKFGEFCYQF